MTKTVKPSAFMREFPAFYFPKRALRRVRRRKPEIRGVLFTDDECRVKIATAVGRPNMTTKQDVTASLAALCVNRPRHLADRHIRTLLRVYGGGALSVTDLQPEYFDAVFTAAGGRIRETVPLSRRPRTPLVADLERRLREGPKRSRPTSRIYFGNPTLAGERRD
jgi:hypothetical protein